MSPSKFLNDNVSIKQYLTNVDWMITTNFVVRHAFILARILVFIETLIKNFSERLKILVLHIRELIAVMSITDTCRVILTWFRSFRLIRFLRRFLQFHLNGCLTIFNLIDLGNQTLYIVNFRIARICDGLSRLKLLDWLLGGTRIDLSNFFKLIVETLECIGSLELLLLLGSQILNQWRILIVSVLFFNDIVSLRCFQRCSEIGYRVLLFSLGILWRFRREIILVVFFVRHLVKQILVDLAGHLLLLKGSSIIRWFGAWRLAFVQSGLRNSVLTRHCGGFNRFGGEVFLTIFRLFLGQAIDFSGWRFLWFLL